MLERLLNYWYALEFFQPGWPIREREDINLLNKSLPWPLENPDPTVRITYDIYFGHSIVNDLIGWALGQLGLLRDDSPIERDSSKVCLCALKVDQNGVYVTNSFAISSFVWALGHMVREQDFGAKLDLDALEQMQNKFNAVLAEEDKPFSLELLWGVTAKACEAVGIEQALFAPAFWACKKLQHQKKDGSFPELEPATELMQSYYVREIARIRKNPGKQIQQYAEALCGRPSKRIEIDSDTAAMQQWLEADRFPLGAWPSVYSPSLMQQLAINISISGLDIFSVNGPPGTGKTTLLKEIIAGNIVRRAARMAAYARPDDAFQKQEFVSPPDQYNRTFYRPDDTLAAYGMLVASNNNAAVENISVELPKSIEKDRTGRFSNTKDISETYFADIATALLHEPAWGLISARLGKKKNLGELKNRLWWAGEGATLKQYYDQTPPDWEAARRDFWTALENAQREQANIEQVQKLLVQYIKTSEEERIERAQWEQCQIQLDAQNRLYEEQQCSLKELEDEYSLYQQDIIRLKGDISGLKRLLPSLFKKDLLMVEWKQTERRCAETMVSITRLKTVMQVHETEREKTRRQARQIEAILHDLSAKKQQLESDLEPARKRFGSNFADPLFWKDICANEVSQAACPWTDTHYDALREELFYRALMLQKAFVLGSNSIKQNLSRLFGVWDGRFSVQDREKAYGSLLNTLFFVVPVISTTFASVQNFLSGVQPGELGILVVDESGQATPQSALGALWRTQKAIVVGDPLQVEPIVTTPLELCKRFAEDNALPSMYKIPELSVQMLADARNPYGGARTINGEQLWLGCPLVIHRRCIDPMFTMSNRVAYNGRMFCKTSSPSSNTAFILNKSVWFDVMGEEIGSKNHTVPSQVDWVVTLLEKAITQRNELPNIYIITPFVSIKRSLHHSLRPLFKERLPQMDTDAMESWLNENCGTIHTFQGKEANEVLIVLGCDRQQGMGAARWVGQKPNIINVAVSRAKYRLGVIGCYDLWEDIPYVQVVCEMLRDAVEKV